MNTVLMFHRVSSRNWFADTLDLIKKIYKIVPMEELDSYFYRKGRLKNACHLTFDDGDQSIFENAFPVLKEMSLPASLFISPKVIRERCNYWFQEVESITDHRGDGLLKRAVARMFKVKSSELRKFGIFSILTQLKLKEILKVIHEVKDRYGLKIKKKYNVTVDQFLELRKSNLFTIGAHTLRHSILRNEDDEIAEKEIRESLEDLSEMIGEKVKYFAYPNGISGLDYGRREVGILKKLKVRLSFSTDQRCFNKRTNPLSIPRTNIAEGSQATLFGQLVLAPMWTRFKNTNFQSRREINERMEIIRRRILP